MNISFLLFFNYKMFVFQSLRRGRLEDSPTTKKSAPPPAVQSSAVQRPETASSHVRSTSTVRTKPTTPVSPMPVLTRTDNARLSLRAKISPQVF